MRHIRVISTLAIGIALVFTAVAASFEAHSAVPGPAPATVTPAVADSAGLMARDTTRYMLETILGVSGKLRALIGLPDSLERDRAIEPNVALAVAQPGVHALGIAAPDGDSLVAVSMDAFPAPRRAQLDGYHVGLWPTRGLAAHDPRYAPPAGYVAVTPAMAQTPVSSRFRLGDFLTHDQPNVWPKVLVLRTPLLDKLELIGDALDARGLPSQLHVMSGFRTPQYNALGVGKKGGRASESRHMYGDAADVFVDANGDGRMDDLNHDGKITKRDAQVLLAVAESVESQHPELIGGLSAYSATDTHGPFVHVDARGRKARW